MKVGATRKGASRGAAWLSSARVVRCWVKSRNERNPYPVLLPAREDSQETAADNVEEGGADVKSSWPLCPGPHTCYNAAHKANRERKLEEIAQIVAQFRLEAATRLHEAGIASNAISER